MPPAEEGPCARRRHEGPQGEVQEVDDDRAAGTTTRRTPFRRRPLLLPAALPVVLDQERHHQAAASRTGATTTGVQQGRLKRGFSVTSLPLLMLLVLLLFPSSLVPSPVARLLGLDARDTMDGAPRDGWSPILTIFKASRGRPIPPSYLDCTDLFLSNPTSGRSSSSSPWRGANGCCVSWAVDTDLFWMDHWTEWKLGEQNRTHQCFDRIRDAEHLRVLQSLAKVQFPTGNRSVPDSVLVKRHTGSGWGIDWAHVVDGLVYAIDHRTIPVVLVSPKGWKYASSFDAPVAVDSPPTVTACPSRDIHCYVLPTHNLSIGGASLLPSNEPIRFLYEWRGFASSAATLHVLEFATRARTWLRREGSILARQAYPDVPSLSRSSSFCAAFHVRRGDVVLHGRYSRRYHAIAEYVHAYQQEQQSRKVFWNPSSNLLALDEILLMTDDANAVAEAQTLYPQFRWVYVQRHRHQGSEGGWENPLPSGNATYEVVVLQALEQLLRFQGRSCDVPVLVHSKSNLADYMYAHLLMTNPNAIRINLDRISAGAVHSVENARSVELSRSNW